MKNILKLVIFDISGTLIDHGSLVTVNTFKKVFKKFKIHIKPELIIKDMGIDKNTHIKKILNEKQIISQLDKLKIKKSTIYRKMCDKFNRILIKEVKNKFDYIDGFDELINFLRNKKIKIALTTGYPRNILDYIIKRFKKKKFYPDYSVSASDVKRGRPHKDMVIKILKTLNIKKENAIKIDDSFSGILEGKNANVQTIGLTLTGINLPVTQNQKKKIPKKKLNKIHNDISIKFRDIKTDYIFKDINDVKKFLKKINLKLFYAH